VLSIIPETLASDTTHQIFVYARSARTGAEQSLSVTVQLKKPLSVGAFTPTPTPPPVELARKSCGSPTPTPTFPPFPVVAAGVTPGAVEPLTLSVANPQTGDDVAHGMYVIQGLAFDTAARGGLGIDHVLVFLDSRDAGGQLLGEAQLGIPAPGGP